MANAFGSITIVDMTDVGQFTTVPMSNAGIVMIYDPNALSNNYTPATITLTPYTVYGGVVIANNDAKISYSWYKRTGGASFDYTDPGTATSSGTSVNVASSDFSGNNKIVTYYLKAVYQYTNNSNDKVTAWGQFSVSLVEQATNIRDIEINGNNLFKYKYTTYGGSPIIDGDSTTTLTATYTSNVAVHQWYYWNYNKTPSAGWDQLTTAIAKGSGNVGNVNGSTCIIDHTANIFNNNRAKIKVTAHRTDDTSNELSSVYDEFELLKLYDGPIGAPGEGTVVLRLTNEDQMIPCDGQGVPTTHAFDLAFTDIEILDGGDDVTSSWTINCTPTGVTGSYNSTNHRYTVNGWAQNNSSEVGYITITAQDAPSNPTQVLTKIMSLTKIQTGSDGKTPTVYSLSITPNQVATNSNNQVTSNTTLTANVIAHTVDVQTSAAVNTDVTTSTDDIIYYQWFVNGSSSPAKANAGSSGYTYGPITSGTAVTSVVCQIRRTNSSGAILDSQSVSFTPKGEKGATGATGDGAITLDFPQNTDTISLDNTGTLTSQYSITLPFTVYQGSTALSGSAVDRTDPLYSMSINGVTPTATWGTTSITLTIPANTQLYNKNNNNHSLNGQCVFPIDYTATSTNTSGTATPVSGTVLGTFSWNLDIAPANGSSVTITDTWTRYRQTNSSTQPSGSSEITKNGTGCATTIAGAITAGGLSKPYYVWGRTHITYSDNNTADTYTVNYYPTDPSDGETPTITSNRTYACTATNSSAPADSSNLWKPTVAAAVTQAGLSEPYYIWEKTVTSYSYSVHTSQNTSVTTYSVSYYPADVYELTIQANSTIFNGTVQTITLQPIVTKNHGSYTIGSGEIQWWYVLNGTLTRVQSTTSTDSIYLNNNQLIITPAAVNGGTSVQCRFIKDGKTFYQYLPIEDYTDEFRCELFSTIGDKITNGQGSGFVECLLYRNGYEIDKVTTNPTVTSAREATGASPHAAVISIATEMGANPKPSNVADISSIVYAWTYKTVDSNGTLQPLNDSTYNASGKAIYIDGSMIDKKIMINCEVTVTYITA